MAVKWEAVQLERLLKDGDKDNVVTTVHWQATDSEIDGENTYSGRCYGTVGLAAPGDSFTPYADITEEQAIGWAKSALGDDEVAAFEKSVENQIDQQKNPTNAEGVPW
tara:strand:- start:634 stop:957 length:324 start_codon:yes stop_codon:yes gene_type:complete